MESPQFEDRMSKILFSEAAIQERVREMATQITNDYTEKGLAKDPQGRPLLLVGVLRGALLFMTDLARRFPIPVEYDLISVSSYGNGTAPGAVRLVKDLEKPIEGRDVLLVEDIIDTGYTIEYLRRSFIARNPASFRVCTLVDKVARREVETSIDYTGFALEQDEFIVGYGMDYAELYRNLPYVGILKPEFIG
ncbi:hypoxanthine phosphoribosyltransferase [Candidatus Bipolaricaulota bacterium]|nr:hypoxanthine phosphoribosyltransferase [Candidatus Bipolaricaulota bacterium]